MKRSIDLDMSPEDFNAFVKTLDPQELKGLYFSLNKAKTTIHSMITVTQLEVMERVLSGEADPEGVTIQ